MPEAVRRAANEACIYIADAPVLSEGRLELLWHTEEQNLSIDYHRYGNLGARANEKRNGPIRLNDVVKGVGHRTLEISDPIAEVRHRDTFEGADDCFAHFLHHAADGALGFIRAGATLVVINAHTTHRRERPLQMPNNVCQRNLIGGTLEAIPPSHAAAALDKASRLEVIQNLLKKSSRNVLLLRDVPDPHDLRPVVHSQNQKCPQCIFPSLRQFHAARKLASRPN